MYFCITALYAQQDAMYTHYAFNTLSINPAYAGSREALSVTALSRTQWVGFEGAPRTQTLTLHGPALKNKVGLGLSVINDKLGPVSTTSLNVDFAYHLKISQTDKLSFGLKGGLDFLRGEFATLPTTEAGDQSVQDMLAKETSPNIGFGAYYYSSNWYVGASVPHILKQTLFVNSSSNINEGVKTRSLFFIAGTVLDLNDNGSLKLKPTTFLKVTEQAPIQGDLTALFIIKDKFEVGGMYRSGDALGILAGYNIRPNLRVGYSYDASFANKTGSFNSGSHEVMLRYDFMNKNTNKIKIVSPRYL